MNTTISHYFLSKKCERDYVLFKKLGNDLKYASSDAIHATHLTHKNDAPLEVKNSTLHFTVVIIALHVNYILE